MLMPQLPGHEDDDEEFVVVRDGFQPRQSTPQMQPSIAETDREVRQNVAPQSQQLMNSVWRGQQSATHSERKKRD